MILKLISNLLAVNLEAVDALSIAAVVLMFLFVLYIGLKKHKND